MATSTDLRVRVSADIADIRKNLGLVTGALAQLKAKAAQSAPDMTGWSRGLAGIRQQVAGVAAAYVGLRGIGGIVRGVLDSFDQMDRIDEMRQMVAMSSEDLSKFAYAAQFSGVELESLGKGFSFFQRNLGENSKLLAKLGVDAPTLTGKLRQLMDVFAKLPDGPEKAAVAADLFGSRFGANLIPLLNEGTKNFDELSDAAARTGNVFDDEATAGAAQFNDRMDTMKATMAGVFNIAAQQLVPVMSAYAGEANEAAQQSEGAVVAGRALAIAFRLVATGAAIVKNVVEGVVNVLAFLADGAIRSGKIVLNALGGAFSTVGASMKAFLTGGPLAAFNAFTEGVKKNSGALLKASKDNAVQLKSTWNAMSDGVGSAVNDIGKAFSAAFAAGTTGAANAKAGVEGIGKAAKEATGAGEALRKMLADFLNPDKGKDVKGGGAAKGAQEKAKEAIAGLVDQGALAIDQVNRDLDALEQRYEDGGIKLAAYFAQRTALQLQAIDLQIQQTQAEVATATSTEQQSRALTEIIKLQRDRAAIGPAAAHEQAKAEKEAAAATQEALDAANAQQREAANSIREGAFQSIRGFFADLIQGTVSFKDAFRNMVSAFAAGLADMAANALATNIAEMLFGKKQQSGSGGGGGLLGGFVTFLSGLFAGGSANGNVFGSGGLQAFAKGGAFAAGLGAITAFANGGAFTNRIVSSPQMFTFGQGGQFGVMGEAGPEAVMPLTRGPGGRLGVDAHGGRSELRQRFVFVDDQRTGEAMLNGALGEKAVLLHIGRNAGAIKEILT